VVLFNKLIRLLAPLRPIQKLCNYGHYREVGGSGGSAPEEKDALSSKYHHLREDYHILEQILDVSHKILTSGNTSQTLEDSFKHVIQICQDALGCDTSVIELYDQDNQSLIGVATDYGAYKPEGYFELPLTESSLSGLAYKAGHTVAIDDVKTDPRVSQRIRRQFSAQSGIAAPLLIEGEVMGVLLTMTRERKVHFTPRDVALMEGLAHEAALAVHTQLLHKQRIQAEHRFQRLIELAPSPILLLDCSLKIIEINKKTSEVFGYPVADIIGTSFLGLIQNADEWQQDIGKPNIEINFETHLTHQNGHSVPVEVWANQLVIAGHKVIQVFLVDMTDRVKAQMELRQEKEKAQTTLRSIGDAVITSTADGKVDMLNPSAEALIGDTGAIGQPIETVFELIDEKTRKPLSNPVKRCIETGGVVDLTDGVVLINSVGDETQVEVHVTPLVAAESGVNGAVMVLHDVGPARRLAQEMSYLATHDALTGLANRSKFEDCLQIAIDSVARGGRTHVLCYIDLDRFKIVNDTCGHIAGDELLKQLTHLFQQSVRESDTLARLGGDEFGLLLEGCDVQTGRQIAETICARVKEYHFTWGNKRFEVGTSIGLIEIGPDSGDLTQILSSVDSACYEAKDRGRNRVQVFRNDDTHLIRRHGEMQWTQRLQNALVDDRFRLYTQSILDLHNENAEQANEVFVKMLGEDGRIVPANAFIPSAERFHLMPEVDKWVIRHTFAYVAKTPNSRWFINLSGQSIGDDQVLRCIIDQVEDHNIDPEQVFFEVNETAVIANLSRAVSFMKTLRGQGFRFGLDDFGSGLSTFAYLKNLSVDFIKIHGNFVRNIDVSPENRVMLEAINKVAHSQGLKTIAENVENKQVVAVLRELGVDCAQGFGIDPPIALDENS